MIFEHQWLTIGGVPNLVPDWDFEDGGTMLVSGPITVQFTTFANAIIHGTRALGIIVDGSPDATAIAGRSIGTVTPGEWIGFHAWIRESTDAGYQRTLIHFHNDDFSVSVLSAGPWINPGGTYQDTRTIGQVPAGATAARVYVQLSGSNTSATPPLAGGVIHSDAWGAVRAASSDEAARLLDAAGDDPNDEIGYLYGVVVDERDTQRTAYAPATITRSRASGLNDADPGTYDVDVTVPPGTPGPTLGDKLRAKLVVNGAQVFDPRPSFIGWVQSVRQVERTMRRPDGTEFTVDAYRVSASDVVTMIARRKIGTDPFPVEGPAARTQKIAALIDDLPFEPLSGDSGLDNLAPRDVDNTNALDLIRDTIAGIDNILWQIDDGRITPFPRDLVLPVPDALIQQPDDSWTYVRNSSFTCMHIPAGAVELPALVLDYDLLINRASVGFKVFDPESGDYGDTSVTYRDDASIRAHGESSYRIAGDALKAGAAGARAARVVDRSAEPMWRLDGDISVPLHLLDPATDTEDLGLIVSVNPYSHLIAFPGAPEEIDVWRINGVQIVYGGDDNESLTLQVEPWPWAGPSGLTFTAIAGANPITFQDMQDAGNLTFADTARLSTMLPN